MAFLGTIEFEGIYYGLIPEGFRVMPQPVCERYITSKLVENWQEDIVANDVDPDSMIGQQITTESEQMAIQFELAQADYNAFDPDLSEDDALDKNLRMVGVKRDPGSFTRVDVLCDGTPGTILLAGRLVSASTTGAKFKLLAETEILAGGTLAVFEATERGAVKVLSGQINVIDTPVLGWDSVSNPEDGIIGRPKELDSEARVRRRNHVSAGGSGRVDPIREAVLNVPGVLAATVYENDLDVVNERGQAKRSVEVVVDGGDNDDIAQALWDNKPGATPYVGNVSGSITDSQGFTRIMPFSRVQLVPIYVKYFLLTDSSFPANGEALIIENTIRRGDALPIGEDVIISPFMIANTADSTTGERIDGILGTEVFMGVDPPPPPLTGANITITDLEKADFDSSRIEFLILVQP